jgi:hypothetical protein
MSSAPRWLLVITAAPLLALAVACGGGDGKPSNDVELAANTVILTYFDILSGKKGGQALIDLYAPECRQSVRASDIDGVINLIAAFAPELTKLKIEAVDLGKLHIENVGDQIHVVPADTKAIKVKVDGKFVNADDYLNSITAATNTQSGSSTTTMASSISEESSLTLVRRDGRLYVGDCSDLKEFSNF